MSTEHPATDFYVTGGTMSPDAESYVVRAADDELFRAVERGEFCYVLTTRQMGKSSLMARTAQRLAAAGVRSAQITLETIRESGEDPKPDQFLYGVARRIHKELGLATNLADWWRARELLSATQRFHEFLTELLLESCESPMVVFIDEIDSTIGLPFADDFYATIRACYNGRASKPELKRLTFVLLGVATPAQLIADPTRTPFNIGKGIELTDFTAEEAEPLSRAFSGTAGERQTLMDRVLYWTGGHPYLTQTLCRAIATRAKGAGSVGGASAANLTSVVDEEVDQLFLRSEAAREERNLKFVRSRLTQGHRDLRSVLRTYQQVLTGKRIEDKPASSIHASLKLAGVVRVDAAGQLRPRNRIYERVFGRDWVRREMPRNRARIVMAVSAAAVLVSAVGGFYAYQQTQRAQAQLEDIEARLREQDRARAETLQQLVRLAEANPVVWEPGSGIVTEQFLRQVGPDVIAEGPWQDPGLDPSRLLDVIERSHRLFVSSRDTFGAMSFALEEVWLRAPEGSALRERARALHDTVREAFIRYHKEKTPRFEEPPASAAADALNPMLSLPARRFEMGAADITDDERPVHSVQVSLFSIQQHEVTNGEYRRFDPDHEFSGSPGSTSRAVPTGQDPHPVANVSWYEAAAYAAWLGGALPTEAQWEYAARGTGATSGRLYPWGNEAPDDQRAVFAPKVSTEPVGSRPAGRTPEGLDDMGGNVWEWCRDWYGAYRETSSVDPPGPTSREASPLGAFRLRVLRGGSFFNSVYDLRAASRSRIDPDYRSGGIGFRVVSSRLRP